MIAFFRGCLTYSILIRFATAHGKIVFLTSALNPPRVAEYCELRFTEKVVYFSMPGCAEPQCRPPYAEYILYAVFVVAIRCLS